MDKKDAGKRGLAQAERSGDVPVPFLPAIEHNERTWNRLVEEKCGFTIPWLDLDLEAFRAFREGETDVPPPTPCDELANRVIMEQARGKNMLLLGAGGGQQSAVFALLGARVTVVELAEKQLEGDRKAAGHYGYDITTIHGDMQDISCLTADSFDLVYATGLCYLPDIGRVYEGVARVLRPGGLFRMDFVQPAVHAVKWDGRGYCVSLPYAEKVRPTDGGCIEFRHYMDEIFNGLLDAGFSIQRVFDDPPKFPDRAAVPGTWAHEKDYVHGGFDIVARKE